MTLQVLYDNKEEPAMPPIDQPWSDPALEYSQTRPRKLTLEQQQEIYDAYYDGVHPPYAGVNTNTKQLSITVTIKQLAHQYGVSTATIERAIEWEQIRRINPKAGQSKL